MSVDPLPIRPLERIANSLHERNQLSGSPFFCFLPFGDKKKMNIVYRSVWCAATSTWVAASELTVQASVGVKLNF
ncbi:ESPR domain-containing protein [Variovorax paradoxus]|uniref:ESPR domain-containing protein n=1 Tax=Variovorax paradoxus TaxID=34073 RepID=UPI00339B7311